jgi:hypothetical protein
MAYVYKGTQHDATPEPRAASTPGPKPKGYNPDNCGTYKGYKQHYRYGVDVCEPCRVAAREYRNSRYVPKVRELKPCGTHAAYRRHLVEGTEVCDPCNEANNAYHREPYKAQVVAGDVVRAPFDDSACGTYKGYRRHTRRGMDACIPCIIAANAYMAEYRAARRAA